MQDSTRQSGRDGLQPEADGSGPLLERDYYAVIDSARGGPAELADMLARRFPAFAPSALVGFLRPIDAEASLEVGDELEVRIAGAGSFGIRVIHRDRQSLTVATLAGHPEAGRITFGAYRNDGGDVVFHIRSRARASSRSQLMRFLFAGDAMQTNTWTDFVNRFAATAGNGVVGMVHAEKREVDPEPGDEALDRPTYVARGG